MRQIEDACVPQTGEKDGARKRETKAIGPNCTQRPTCGRRGPQPRAGEVVGPVWKKLAVGL